jgi:hypothetical protein
MLLAGHVQRWLTGHGQVNEGFGGFRQDLILYTEQAFQDIRRGFLIAAAEKICVNESRKSHASV